MLFERLRLESQQMQSANEKKLKSANNYYLLSTFQPNSCGALDSGIPLALQLLGQGPSKVTSVFRITLFI